MPTEDFLARLVKSKAAGASTMIPTAGVETGPKAASKTPVSLPGVVGADVSETVVGKFKEKKRYRDGHSSKNPHSKKLKDSVSCPVSGELVLQSEDDVGTLVPRVAGVVPSGSIVGNGLRGFKELSDRLSAELEMLLNLDDDADVLEVKKLRGEVRDLRKLNKDLEETSKNLANDNKVAADKLFAALTEKSELITECDSLGGQMKNLELENQSLKTATKELEDNLAKGVEAWTTERADLVAKIEDSSAQLTKCQSESLSSFEEGYGECVGRLASSGVDMASHTFEHYLADVAKKGVGNTGSSDAAPVV